MTNREIISLNNGGQVEQNAQDTLDLEKLWFLTKRSWWVIVLLLIIGVGSAFLIVRYTKPLYESQAVIKLKFENEANALGLVQNQSIQNEIDMSGEIEIILSDLFLTRVIEELSYDISYYRYGTYLTDERYGNSPIDVSYKIHDGAFNNRPIDIEIIDDKSFKISVNEGQVDFGTYRFDEPVSNQHFNFLVQKTDNFDKEAPGRYFVRINTLQAMLNYFKQNLKVQPENFSAKTIKISLSDFNVSKARAFVSTISSLYLDYTTIAKNQTLEKKIEFLDEQIASTRTKLDDLEQYFESFIIENRTVSLQSDMSSTIVLLNKLDSQLFNMREHEQSVKLLQEQLALGDDAKLNPFLLNRLPKFIMEAVVEYEQLAEERALKLNSYNENTSVVRRIDFKLNETKSDLMELVSLHEQGVQESIESLRRRRKTLESSFVELPSMGTEYDKNQRMYNIYEGFIMSLRQSKMDLEITRAGTVPNSLILSPASTPSAPIKPQPLLIYGVGFVMAIVLSVLFILVRYLLHNKISSITELERLTDIPIIGSTPFYKGEKLPNTKLVIDTNSKSAISESLRSIRTNLEFIRPADVTRLLTITSTISGEGKTFIAANLGAIIASSGQSVCIVDLDMRKPKVNLAFGDEASPVGVSTILSGKNALADAKTETRVENLFYIPAGPTPPNPSELIISGAFDKMLDSLRDSFDLVILDTPPVGLVTDGVLAMKKSDFQLYVVKAEYSQRGFIKTIQNIQQINGFNKMSLLLNAVKTKGHGHGYGYGYGYGYYEEQKPSGGIMKSLF